MSDTVTCLCSAAAPPGLIPYLFDKLFAPAIVAVVFGGSAAYVLELYRGRREAATKIAEGLRDDLKAAHALVIDYWARPYQVGDEIIEAQLIGLQTDIAGTLTLLDSLLREKVSHNMAQTMASLFDVLTGGDFQSKTREADTDRISKSANFISKLRTSVTRARYHSMSKILGA